MLTWHVGNQRETQRSCKSTGKKMTNSWMWITFPGKWQQPSDMPQLSIRVTNRFSPWPNGDWGRPNCGLNPAGKFAAEYPAGRPAWARNAAVVDGKACEDEEDDEADAVVAGVVDWAAAWPGLTNRLRMLLSDMARRWLTEGILASVAGSRLTSCFMSLSNSSSWFRTVTIKEDRLLQSTSSYGDSIA